MIELLGKIPRKIGVAFSGGIDSVAALDFLFNNHDVTILYFDHSGFMDTGNSNDVLFCEMVELTAKFYNIDYRIGKADRPKLNGESREEYWRNMRYDWLESQPFDYIATAHHLDDCVETWVWSSLHGNPRVIPYNRNNVYRPFLLNKKEKFVNWVERQKLVYMAEESNNDETLMRNYIRKNLMPHALHVNKGLHKVVKKKIIQDTNNLLTCNGESYTM